MNVLRALPVFAMAVTTFAATTAPAGILITFDENGNGTWDDTNAAPGQNYSSFSTTGCVSGALSCGTLAFTTAPDPTGSVGGNVLIYELPELVNAGPVAVGEPGDIVSSGDASPSDVLFFTTSQGITSGAGAANLMIYYSGDNNGALADTGLPTGTFTDIADEQANGTFQWLPDGTTFAANANEYDGISDTPEPASVALIGFGMLGLGLVARKRRAA